MSVCYQTSLPQMQVERDQRIRDDVANIKRSFYCEVRTAACVSLGPAAGS
jgi:hypothetical protein